jgi:hypothetical protein
MSVSARTWLSTVTGSAASAAITGKHAAAIASGAPTVRYFTGGSSRNEIGRPGFQCVEGIPQFVPHDALHPARLDN